MLYNVDEKGYYGDFGGAYIPEMLYPNVEELRNNYKTLTAAPEFQKNFTSCYASMLGALPRFTSPADCLKNTRPKSI